MNDTVGRIVQLSEDTPPSKSVQRRLMIQVNAQIERERDELRARVEELETKLRRLERFYSHTFAGTGVRRCAHCGSEGDSAEPPEHASTCPYYGLPVIDLEVES